MSCLSLIHHLCLRLVSKQICLSSRSQILTAFSHAALTKAYASGDVSAYRELAESIRREKEVNPPSAPYGYPAPQQQLPHDARASPAPYGRANLALPSINNMSSHAYSSASTSNGHSGYGAYNGAVNGHRAYQPSPQGMSCQFVDPLSTPTQYDQQLRPHQQVEGPTFKPSPFYRVEQRIGNVHFCQGNERLKYTPINPSSETDTHQQCRNIDTQSTYRSRRKTPPSSSNLPTTDPSGSWCSAAQRNTACKT